MDRFVPRLTVHRNGSELTAITLGHRLLDDYLVFVAARARSNTWLAIAWDLKVFFGVVGKPPAEVSAADVFAFLAAQRAPRRGERVVRLDDGEAGLAARTLDSRRAIVRGLYAYLVVRGDAGVVGNPVPGSLAARRPSGRRGNGGVPLIRTPRTLPQGPSQRGHARRRWPVGRGRRPRWRRSGERCCTPAAWSPARTATAAA